MTLYQARPDQAGLEALAQEKIMIAKDDDHLSLYNKLADLGGSLLDEALPLIAKGKPPRAAIIPLAQIDQDLAPIDPRIDWSGDAWLVCNKVRALTRPNPGAFALFMGEKMTVWRAIPDEGTMGIMYARELQVDEGRAMVGACKGTLRLQEVQWQGQLLQDAEIAEALEPHWREKFE